MVVTQQHLFRVLIACAVCLALPAVGSAQADSDADNREVTSYRLTQPALAKYAAATRALATVLAENPPDCDEDQNDQSLDAMVAEIRGIPAATEAIESAGMPVREYVVLTWAMVQAGFAAWGLDQPGGELPPGVSMANVEFFRAHEAEFQEAASLVEPYECDDNEDDGYDEEAPDENDPEE